jgi:hypothetical protein
MSMSVDVSVESSVEGIVNGDTYGGDPDNRLMTNFLNLSLDFFDLRVEDNLIVRLSTSSSPRTSRSFSSILNINPTCFSYSPDPLSFNSNSSFLLIQQLFVPFSSQISDFSVPLLCHFSPCPHDPESAISLHVSTRQLFSGLAVPTQLNFLFFNILFLIYNVTTTLFLSYLCHRSVFLLFQHYKVSQFFDIIHPFLTTSTNHSFESVLRLVPVPPFVTMMK